MLSYRHGFHAGNYADVLKHLVLSEILVYMIQKPKPLWYADTHAGAGGYALTSAQAQKTAEYQTGIGKLWQQKDLPEPLNRYLENVTRFNAQNVTELQTETNTLAGLQYYPGSPWFAKQLLREHDRLSLFELQNQEFNELRQRNLSDRRVYVKQTDGFQGLIAALPPKEKRGVVLIDPSYELKEDYQKVVELVKSAHQRFATGTYVIWYPVVERSRIHQMQKALTQSGIRNIQRFELGVCDDTSGRGMTASGMIVINPPWTLMQTLTAVLPELAQRLAGVSGRYCADTWVEE